MNKIYTVIGLWDGEENDRFAECYYSLSAAGAEQLAREEAERITNDATLIIAGTICGVVEVCA